MTDRVEDLAENVFNEYCSNRGEHNATYAGLAEVTKESCRKIARMMLEREARLESEKRGLEAALAAWKQVMESAYEHRCSDGIGRAWAVLETKFLEARILQAGTGQAGKAMVDRVEKMEAALREHQCPNDGSIDTVCYPHNDKCTARKALEGGNVG